MNNTEKQLLELLKEAKEVKSDIRFLKLLMKSPGWTARVREIYRLLEVKAGEINDKVDNLKRLGVN